MYYYYIKDGTAIISKEEPQEPYIVKQKAVPVLNRDGYISKLNVDVENNRIWYELEEKPNHIIERQIIALKNNLSNTDYKAIKYAEGQITEEDYAPIKAQRQSWRDEINRLEGDIVESEN